MIKNIKFLLTALIILTTTTVYAGTFKANANTKRIPAGTIFTLEFIQPFGTYSGAVGDGFTAVLKNEQTAPYYLAH